MENNNSLFKKTGKLIVIDGTDGSGKATQTELLVKTLKKHGYKVKVADFPQYNTKSAGIVEEYLSGKYGEVEDIDPYTASIFYAIDRYDASFKIRQWLEKGNIVISNRYVTANMGHQGAKLSNKKEREIFFKWLFDLEYNIFNLPKPDLNIILHVPPSISKRLIKERPQDDWHGKTKDIHEDNIWHLEKAEKVYLEIAKTYPKFKLIKCTGNGKILSREKIHKKIWEAITKILFIS